MPRAKKIKPDSLTFDDRNANMHTPEGEAYVGKSLSKNGAGRSVLADKNGKLIAGNLTVKKALEAGMKLVEVETDPDTLVVVKRSDLDLDDREDSRARELAIADNRAGELSLNWDYDQLVADAEDYGFELEDWSIEVPEVETDNGQEKYTRKIEAPMYEPGDVAPFFDELYDTSKYDKLVADIHAEESLTDDEREYLLAAAQRHVVFNYERAADLYANSRPELQRLMEDSALVIIDFGKAIQNGYVQLNEDIKASYIQDYGHE